VHSYKHLSPACEIRDDPVPMTLVSVYHASLPVCRYRISDTTNL